MPQNAMVQIYHSTKFDKKQAIFDEKKRFFLQTEKLFKAFVSITICDFRLLFLCFQGKTLTKTGNFLDRDKKNGYNEN